MLSEADVARQFKVDVDEVLLGVGRVRERCSAACRGPVVSAYTFIEVYLEALLAGQLDRKVGAIIPSHHSILGFVLRATAVLLVSTPCDAVPWPISHTEPPAR